MSAVRFELTGYRPQYGSGIEHSIVRALLRELSARGWYPVRFNCDGEEPVRLRSQREAMDAVFSVDVGTLVFRKKGQQDHGVLLVCGNGIDIISDFTVGADDFPDACTRVADAAEPCFDERG